MKQMDCEMDRSEQMDALDRLIVDRLAERQRKANRMAEWTAKPSSRRNWYVVLSTISVAACMVMVFFTFDPFVSRTGTSAAVEQMERPDLSSFRAACPELAKIEQLMDAGDYEGALDGCKELLHHSDIAISKYKNLLATEKNDEELQYEYDVENTTNHDIRWTYIYLLLKTGHESEALAQIDKCMEDADNCNHINEAKALKENLKKK